MMEITGGHNCNEEKHSLKTDEDTESRTWLKILSFTGLKKNIEKLKTVSSFRDRFVYSLCVTWLVFVQGWIKGQIGPAFPNILYITSTELGQGSAYLTSYYVGKILGSMSGGLVFDKCNKNGYISIVYLLHAVAIAAIPWCVHFEVMVSVFCCTGFLSSWMDVAGITCTIGVYGAKGNVYVQMNQLVMAVASVLSPLVSAPYLLPQETENQVNHMNESVVLDKDTLEAFFTNSSSTYTYGLQRNYTSLSSTSELNQNSQLFIPFTITAGLIITSSLMFFALQMYNKRNLLFTPDGQTHHISDTTSRFSYYICVINIFLLGVYVSALEVSMSNLLPVFCIKQLGWSPAEGAFAISIFFCAYTISRIISIIASKYLRPSRIIFIYTIISTVVFSFFLLSAYLLAPVWNWISVALCGFAVSGMFPALLVCLNQFVLYVSGKFASLFLATSYVGSFAIPPLVGFLMIEYNTLWFAYVNVIICILSLISLISIVYIKNSTSVRSSIVVKC